MNDYEKRAAANHPLVVKAGYQILIAEEEFARQLAEKYGATVRKTDDGWLVQKPIPEYSEDDPIIKIIRDAVERLR